MRCCSPQQGGVEDRTCNISLCSPVAAVLCRVVPPLVADSFLAARGSQFISRLRHTASCLFPSLLCSSSYIIMSSDVLLRASSCSHPPSRSQPFQAACSGVPSGLWRNCSQAEPVCGQLLAPEQLLTGYEQKGASNCSHPGTYCSHPGSLGAQLLAPCEQ